MSDKDKPSIFQKLLDATETALDAQIHKAKTTILNQEVKETDEDDLFYGKTLLEDPSYAVHSGGWKEKPHRLQNGHLKQMSYKDSVVVSIIHTRQNQVSNHSDEVESEKEKGWRIRLTNEEEELEKIKEQLKADMAEVESQNQPGIESEEADFNKAENSEEPLDVSNDEENPDPENDNKKDDEVEQYDWELERKARAKLDEKYKSAKKAVSDYVKNCGKEDLRPFETKRWNFEKALRAWVRDSLTYDLYATEIVPDKAGRPHHWFPIDGGTIKFSSERLADYKQIADNFLNTDLLYPEKKAKALDTQKTLELDEDLVAKNAYRFVQVIRGKIERAYTEDELKVGIRNQVTDIYNNGYGLAELELVVALVTGHLNAEYYNQSYFTQGFSAKGILHLKAALNKRKMEMVRQQWHAMIRGVRNSFQTPIFAGLEDVNWIPLTQNHNDIGFEGWMRYLVKMICAIYQIDPHEIGIGFKDEGGRGSGGLSGDNTQEKVDMSKDKGLYPLIRHIQNYVNENIVKPFDSRFEIEFTGITSETEKEIVERQERESKFKKTLNEIRAEDGLPPIPGGDDLILGQEYMQWYLQMSPAAQKFQQDQMQQQQDMMGDMGTEDENELPDDSFYHDQNFDENFMSPNVEEAGNAVQKALKNQRKMLLKKSRRPRKVKIEYYKIG